MSVIKKVAEEILGRNLIPAEGMLSDEISEKEKQLRIKFPPILKDYYLYLGNIPLFMDGCQLFIAPYIYKGKLVFLEESQGAVYWGIDISDIDKDSIEVYQISSLDDDAEWKKEGLTLTDFLLLIMYYQAANTDSETQQETEGAYNYCCSTDTKDLGNNEIWEDFMSDLHNSWEKVIDNKGLLIYWNSQSLVWYMTHEDKVVDDTIYLNLKDEEGLIEFQDKYKFYEL